MARGDKLVGAMSKRPSMAGLTRVSPGVYRNAEGQLVRGQGGQPRQNRGGNNMQDAMKMALNGVSQYGNPAQSNEPMQTLPLMMGNMSPEQRQQMMDALASMGGNGQQPQSDRFVGDPWRAMRDGSGKGGLQNMALRSRNQNQQMQQAAMQEAMQGLQNQPQNNQQALQQALQQMQGQPMPMPGRGYRR